MTHTAGRMVIDAPIASVWAIVRDFTSTPKWFPSTVSCRIEGDRPADQIGVVKLVELPDGDVVRERLTGLSDRDHVLTYRIEAETVIDGARAAPGTEARVALHALTQGTGTIVEWSHDFEVTAGDRALMVAFYRALYPIFFAGLAAASSNA